MSAVQRAPWMGLTLNKEPLLAAIEQRLFATFSPVKK